MLSVLDSGLARELQAILTLYLGTFFNGYSLITLSQHYSERHQPENGARQPAGRLLWRQGGTQEVSHGGQCAGGYL